ncbi:Eco57I restriction-modification methylase domain-containing protein [Halorussus aquaticus]|uniref:Eco57I restriction-modification methylase domain-containing protein n=1 Tax=Halorussus aquaticus TaxID=2953748 RepID=UPI0020B73937|nr:DNA methyltransferase [Halorussus aquaticus]
MTTTKSSTNRSSSNTIEDKQNPDFGSLPYLNGGLFARNPVEEEFEDAKLGGPAEETNELFDDILDFLSDWNWNVDERLDIVDPKNLSPAILGHIFEQTVNQKEMGAYYTPEEITGFMARRTIHPYLLDQLNETVDADYDEIDNVFGFPVPEADTSTEAVADGGTITQQVPTEKVQTSHVETLYHDILKEAHILDPAVGSGAFLLAAQEVLMDLYMQCIEYFQQLESEGQGWELESRSREELESIEGRHGGESLYAKRSIILDNLYGVDIDEGAVEICKLRLWLSMVADIEDEPGEVEPLPNIDFNIRQGNSLIGFTDLIETVNEEGDTSLTNYGIGEETPVSEYYEDVIHAQRKHKRANSSKEATNARRQAESLITSYSQNLDNKVLDEFHSASAEITLDQVQEFYPFHWILEFALVYDQGGFDLIIGNPPWDQLRASRDDYFVKFDEQFRSRMPSNKDEMQKQPEDEEISEGWEEYQEQIEKQMRYFTDGSEYTLQKPVIDGRKDPNENNLAALFFERLFDLVSKQGYVAQVLPGVIFSGSFSKDLRLKLLDDAEIKTLVGFENHGIFEEIDNRYQFAILSFKNSGKTDQIEGVFDQRDVSVLRHFDEMAITIPREVLSQYSLKARIFPNITHPEEVGILKSIVSHPPLGEEIEEKWNVTPHRELDRSRASDRFVEEENEGDYPVYGGANIHQFQHDNTFDSSLDSPSLWSVDEDRPDLSAKYRVRERAYNGGTPKKDIYEAFGGPKTSKSQKGFVNDLLQEHRGQDLCMDDLLPDFTGYRIIYRDIARPTDERTMISTVLPKGIVCVHTLQTFSPYEVNPEQEDLSEYPLRSIYERAYDDEELFVITGLLNSIPFDYLMRTKVDSHIVRFKLEESQVPRLTEGDNWFHYISDRAARLNCYGEEFEEMRERLGGIEPAKEESERRRLQAEIDAASFHAYGLDRGEMQFVLDDFHRVSNPRIMTEAYIEKVAEKYTHLGDVGPME